MATQNHTATYLSLRENFQRRNRHLVSSRTVAPNNPLSSGTIGDDVESLLGGASSASPAVDPRFTLPPVWVDSKDACEGMIAWLEESMVRLDKAHEDRLVVRFDDEMEGEHDREIDALTRQMTKKFREAEGKLKEIGSFDQQKASDDEISIRKNVQRSLASRLQTLSLRFRKSQKEYMSKLRTQKQSGQTVFNEDTGDDPLNTSSHSAFLMSQEEERESLSQRIHERDEEIGRIAKSIEDLALIFKELAVLVIEQGTVLDRIDYNMEVVIERTKKGVLELEKAEKYQKSNRAQWCIFILVALIVFFFILIVAKLN